MFKIKYTRVEAGAYTAHLDLRNRPGHVFISIVKTDNGPYGWYAFVTRVTPTEDLVKDVENIFSTVADTYGELKDRVAHELKAQDWLGMEGAFA